MMQQCCWGSAIASWQLLYLCCMCKGCTMLLVGTQDLACRQTDLEAPCAGLDL